jgi:hypothetical protein
MGDTVISELLFLIFRTENLRHEKKTLKFEFMYFLNKLISTGYYITSHHTSVYDILHIRVM